MPVQYPAGLMAEHQHTRQAAGLFDVSHMGQLRLEGADAAAALRDPDAGRRDRPGPGQAALRPAAQRRRATILDDLMFVNRGDDLFVIVNGACKDADIAHMQQRIGSRCAVMPMPERGLLALQGPKAVDGAQAPAARRREAGVHDRRALRLARPGAVRHPQRLHRRGRLRDLGARRTDRGLRARPAGATGGQAGRPGRAQLAAAGSRAVPVRQRHRHAPPPRWRPA